MKSILKIGALIYFIYKTIVIGRNYFTISNVQNDNEQNKKTKKLRNEFIWYIAGSVIFFFEVLGNPPHPSPAAKLGDTFPPRGRLNLYISLREMI